MTEKYLSIDFSCKIRQKYNNRKEKTKNFNFPQNSDSVHGVATVVTSTFYKYQVEVVRVAFNLIPSLADVKQNSEISISRSR